MICNKNEMRYARLDRFRGLNGLDHALEGAKQRVVEGWSLGRNTSEIIARHDITTEQFVKDVGDNFFDCIIGFYRWGSHITSCDGFNNLIAFINKNNIMYHELVLLQDSLKSSMIDILYEDGLLSKKISDEISELFADMFKEVAEHFLSKAFSFSDIYEKEKQKNIRLLNEYKKAVDESNIVSKTTTKGVITYVNKQFCKISGYTEEELLGQPHNIVRHPEMPKEAFRDMWETIKAKKTWKGIVKNLKKDGGTYIVDTTVVPIVDVDGDIIEYIGIRHDITELEVAKEQLKLLNFSMKKKVNELYDITQNLEQQASTDVLTGIFNRYKFDEMFDIEVKKAKLNKTPLSLILFDIDHFKDINDTFGHNIGDKALMEVTKVVSKNIKRADIFARWGGEEFAVLAIHTELGGAVSLAEKLRTEVEAMHFEAATTITSSFGVAEVQEYDEMEDLLKRADDALYLAKKNGRNRVEVL